MGRTGRGWGALLRLGTGGDTVAEHLDSVVAGEAAGLVGHVHTRLVAEEILVHGEGNGDGSVDKGGHHSSLTVHVVPALDLVGGQHLGGAVLARAEARAAVALAGGVPAQHVTPRNMQRGKTGGTSVTKMQRGKTGGTSVTKMQRGESVVTHG